MRFLKKFCMAILMISCLITGCSNKEDNLSNSSYKVIPYNEIIASSDNYTNLLYSSNEINITDNEIMEYMYNLLLDSDFLKESDNIKEDSIISMQCEILCQGTSIYRSNACIYLNGSHRFGEAFEKNISDFEKGVVKTFKCNTIYNNSTYSNCDVKACVNGIYDYFEINNSNIAYLTDDDYNDINLFKNDVKKTLEEQQREDSQLNIKDQILHELTETTKYNDIPQDCIDEYTEGITNSYKKEASLYGLSLDEYLESINCSEEDIKKQAINNIKENAALYYIFDKENMSISDKEYKEYLSKSFQTYNSDAQNEKEFEKKFSKARITDNLKREKVIDFLMQNASQ